MIEGELNATLLRLRYERLPKNAASVPRPLSATATAIGHDR
jgi:hypothetical protein